MVNNKYVYIPDTKIADMIFPKCTCIYTNNDKYMLAEINTGYRKGSIKVITPMYSSVKSLMDNHTKKIYNPPFLKNHIIYNGLDIRSKL